MAFKKRKSYRLVKIWVYKETLFDLKEHVWTFLGSFVGIALIGLFNQSLFSISDNIFLIGSFGASSVLVYGIINSPLAQPRNLIGGHLLCAFLGVTIHKFVPLDIWLTSALAVSLSIILMQMTKTLHPPGGATALLAVIGSAKIQNLGYWYVLSPVLTGVLILFMVALIFNNITKDRKYPVQPIIKRRPERKKRNQTSENITLI